MEITFLGAAQNVTGSRYLLEHNGRRLLIDCGLYQEREFAARNWDPFPVAPASIDAVLLTHAHIDHCGYLPKLVKDGFKGRIIATEPTCAIAQIALLDTAHMQEHDAEVKRERHVREHRSGPFPETALYGVRDAEAVAPLFEKIIFRKTVTVMPGVEAAFFEAGHILGAAMIKITWHEALAEKTAIFSGDIGRWNQPIVHDPTFFPGADYVIMEATYGNKLHTDISASEEKLRTIINETFARGGRVVIPAFAIERTQELLYSINDLMRRTAIPDMPVFLDSPMAIEVTEVFKKYTSYFDVDATRHIEQGTFFYDFPQLEKCKTTDESKAINQHDGPAIILAGSGMCTGGRIKHHLVHTISHPENTILFVGYQAQGTLGRIILERPREVRIHGQRFSVRARIEKINGFSAHADRDELVRWLGGFSPAPGTIFVTHSEATVVQEFAQYIRGKFKSSIQVPKYTSHYQL